ncbi:MAG: hypothetical protein GXO07_02550, partial [Crenarchaeota archaeon]|nr:hypothetical protein [Thermoproteota archaeon]
EGLFVPRRWGEGGAHEAIRPTRPLSAEELRLEFTLYGINYMAVKLYDLIFRRFMASQMKEAKVKKVKITYEVEGIKVTNEVITDILEEGWTSVWRLRTRPIVQTGEPEVVGAEVRRASSSPLPRVHEVVRWMKEKRVGRPSTYARTIENLRRHGYVVLTPRNYVVATKKGLEAREHVRKEFPELLSVEYTRKLEELMEVARGDLGTALEGVLRTFRSLASAET